MSLLDFICQWVGIGELNCQRLEWILTRQVHQTISQGKNTSVEFSFKEILLCILFCFSKLFSLSFYLYFINTKIYSQFNDMRMSKEFQVLNLPPYFANHIKILDLLSVQDFHSYFVACQLMNCHWNLSTYNKYLLTQLNSAAEWGLEIRW